MSVSITASISNSTNFGLNSTNGNQLLTLTDSANSSAVYLYGTGLNNITNAVSLTGVLESGGSFQVDLYSLPQTTFNATQNVQFTGIKNISIYNTDEQHGYDFTITATGVNACSNLFNGGSGNLLVKPQSMFAYNDPYDGFEVNSSQRYIYLDDAGSGVNYKIFVLGLD